MSVLGNNLLAQYYAQSGGILPSEYRQVEYLQATGTQRIGTVFKATEKTKAIIDFKINVLSPSPWIFGSRNGSYLEATDQFTLFVYGSDDRITTNIGFGVSLINVSLGTSRHLLQMSLYGGVILDDNIIYEYGQDQKEHQFTSIYPLSLFTMRSGESSYNNYMSGRIYHFACVENSVYVCNFIPCVRISDGKPGLYDLCKSICPLTGTPFYINAGTGEFVTP